jgi:hypothetical protein
MERFIMFRTSWLPWRSLRRRNGWQQLSSSRAGRRRSSLVLERLEDRTALSNFNAATVSDLITDINAANKAGGTNTITLTAPTTSPYVLTAVDNTMDGANGLPVIANHDTLTIVGNGDTIERSTASGTPDFRLLDVAKGGSLTLENVTLQNGLAFGSGNAAEGGAIFNKGTLVLSGVTVQGNIAQGSDGINSHDGNDASGGGVWSCGALTAQSGTLVQNNHAIGGAGAGNSTHIPGVGGTASGGGIFVAGGMATLTGVAVDNNVAQGGEGGSEILPQGTALTTGGNAFGGGLCVAAGSVSLSSSTVDNNSATGGFGLTNLLFPEAFGGGLYVGGGIVTLCNDTVQSNAANFSTGDQADSHGGGIYIASGATAYIDSFTVAHTINNTDSSHLNGSTANIDGTYIAQNC